MDCNLCREIAPEFFERSDEAGLPPVCKQSQTNQECERCDEAKEYCPVDAIGSDGELGDPGRETNCIRRRFRPLEWLGPLIAQLKEWR
ncbi:MAG TPA: ferredoxin [Blastocatellia bacterium]|nr:ferredoxin [Blastocatellia bacterium]